MKRLRLNSFGHVVYALVALIVITLVGGTFLFVVNHNRKSNGPSASIDSDSASNTTSSSSDSSIPDTTAVTEDLSKLPVGDGKISTSPKQGYVMSCQQTFDSRRAGAAHIGPWFHDTYWDLNAKTTVGGTVTWPQAKISIIQSGSKRIISGNGLPTNMTTGIFPIQTDSDAYQYDRNPNPITAQSVSLELPADPVFASSPGCVPMGVIGYMTNGVALFNALDAGGRDAAAHEVQDKCDGHPEKNGEYHFHSLSRCIEKTEGNAKIIGYALDGYGITGNKDVRGKILKTSDLDECHGTTSPITWDGKTVTMYHYVITHDYPYSIRCFRGTSVRPMAMR